MDLILKHPAFWWHPLQDPQKPGSRAQASKSPALDFHLKLSMSLVSQGTRGDDTPNTHTGAAPAHSRCSGNMSMSKRRRKILSAGWENHWEPEPFRNSLFVYRVGLTWRRMVWLPL